MKLAKLLPLFVIIIAFTNLLSAQTSPDLENGFKNYGSYHSSDVDTVDLKSGNLMIHIPMPWTYPQRGGAINPKSLLTMSSKTWQTKCFTLENQGPFCYWTPGVWRDQQVALAGSGLGFDHTSDLSIHRTWGYQSDTANNVFYFSSGYTVATPDGGSHDMVASPGASLDPNGDPMAYDATDTSGFHVDLSNPDPTDGTPGTAVATDRHGNRYVGGWFTQPNCRAVFDNQFPGNSSSKSCAQATRLSSITDANGNVFANANDTMGRPFHTFSLVSSGADTSNCVLNGLTFNYSSIVSYAGPNGATNQAKLCYATVNIATAFGVANVAEAQSVTATNNGSSATASVLVTLILPDKNNAISASSPKWIFNYDSYINLTYIGLPTGGSISYAWQTRLTAAPCNKISRVITSRTLTDNNGHSYLWNYGWGQQAWGPSAPLSNTVTNPMGNDTVHTFTDVSGHGSCLGYETNTQEFNGSSGSGQLLKQVDTTFSFAGGVVPTIIKTTLFPSNKVNLITKSYDFGPGPNQPIFGNVVSEKEYDWGQGSPGSLLRETDTTYQWQKDSRYLTAHLLDLPASIVVISPDPNGNPKTNCPGWDSSGNAITKACMAETDYTYDEAAYLTGYEATVGALPTGTHVAAPNPVRGIQTTVSHWLNTTNSFIVSHTNWYDTGEAHQAIDSLGHTTTHSYDPAYAGAYSTQTCSPSTAGITHCASGTYDFQTGALGSLTDENGQTSNYTYDSMGRLTLAQAPSDPANSGARAQTTLNFSPANTFPLSVQRTKSITTSLSDSATNFFDGLGRAYLDQHVLPNGTAKVDTVFDALSRPSSVSNPYFTTSDSTYGTTQTLYDALGRAYQTTKQDGSVSSVDYSAGNCTLTTDEAGHQRKGCSDALGRLVEVDEPNPSAVAHVVINGQVQTNPQSGSPGTGWVRIDGQPVSTQICQDSLPPHPPVCHTVYDSGTVTITVNGYSKSTSYGQVSTAAGVASSLAAAFHNDGSSPVDAAISPSSSNTINFTSRTNAAAANYSLSVSSSSSDPADFGTPAFAPTKSGPALTGGHDPTTNPDTGSVTITVNGVGYSTSYGGADSDGSGIASRLAALVSAGPYANASAAGSTVSLTSKTAGTSGNYSLSASYTWNSASFVQPSFTTSSDVAMSAISNSPYVTLYQYDALGNLLRVDQRGTAPTDSTQWRTRTFTYDSLSRLLTAHNPESGTITYSYDADSNLLQKMSPAPNQTAGATQTVSYCYDALHRVTGKGYGAQSCPLSTPIVTYAYDSGANAKGHLTSLTDQAGTASYTYDILGRLATETRSIAGVSKSTSYTYNLDGSIKTLTYPSGRIVTYTPDSAGRLVSAADGNGTSYVASATYGPDGSLRGLLNGSTPALTQTFQYNQRLQLCRITTLTSGTLPTSCTDTQNVGNVMDRGYDFHLNAEDNGNVFAITNYRDATRSQAFTYDVLNRLTSGWSSASTGTYSWGENYSVDAWGNLQTSPMGTKAHGGTFQLSGNAQNRPTGMAYDAAGNLMSYVSSTYTYDQENRLSSTAGMTYTYDANGERVLKSNTTTGATAKRFWSMGGNTLAEGDGTGNLTAEYVYFGGKRVARIDLPANTVHYYLSDHLGSASIVASSVGTVEEESDYYPFGTEVVVTGGVNELKFTGKRRDSESQLDYFGARFYANIFGRFATADEPFADQEQSDPQSWNLYSYVRNSPLLFADANGRDRSVCGNDGKNCTLVPEDKYKQFLKDNNLKEGGGNLYYVNPDGSSFQSGTTSYVPSGYLNGAGMIGSGQAFVGAFAKQAIIAGVTGGASQAFISGLVESLTAARVVGAVANASVDVANLSQKIIKQMATRGWTTQEIVETVESGDAFPVLNKATGGPATEYINPSNGKFVVVDNTTNKVLQVSGPGFSPNHLVP